jgi:hypothetical protein
LDSRFEGDSLSQVEFSSHHGALLKKAVGFKLKDAMGLNVGFPTETAKAASDLVQYLRASAHERVQAMLGLSRLCRDLRASSPACSRQVQLLDQMEKVEHERWREFLKSHAAR